MKSKNIFSVSDVLVPPALHREEHDVDVPEITIPPGSAAEAVVEKAAEIVGFQLSKYTIRIDPRMEPERFQSACFETDHGVAIDAEQTLARQGKTIEAAIAREVFRRVRRRLAVYPTTLRAQVEAQVCAIEAGIFCRPLLMQQQALAM